MSSTEVDAPTHIAAPVFFAYPSKPPMLRETVGNAARKITDTKVVKVTSWEDLPISGSLIIDRVLEALDASALGCFDVTGLNHNVMFELGYAIGREKPIWILKDSTDSATTRAWEQFRTLTTVGYVSYKNSDDIRTAFLQSLPHLENSTLYGSLIEAALEPDDRAALFYVRSLHENEAARQLGRGLQRASKNYRFRIIDADPSEASVYPLAWYAQQIYSSSVTVIHFAASSHEGFEVHNARSALIGGMALGMGRQVLMLAEHSYSPLDYRDLLFVYQTARECVEHAETWLHGHAETLFPQGPETKTRKVRLGTELKTLRLGEAVAENEEEDLSDYFIETASYYSVLASRTTVFVGRKGTGKTANFLRASAELRSDRRNLTCIIKPQGYEVDALARLLSTFKDRDLKGYLVDSLWQYLIYTEIAKAAAEAIRSRPAPVEAHTPEWELLALADDPASELGFDFAVRLERAITSLAGANLSGDIGEVRVRILQGLHQDVLQRLRKLLATVLSDTGRVAVLIDNLDKGWDKAGDLDDLSYMLLGLLTAIGRVSIESMDKKQQKKPVQVSLAVFIRTDIFAHISKLAREPDKIPVAELVWNDPAMLRRVIEERYASAHESAQDGAEIWTRFFVPKVRGLPTPDYIISRILPRPRDIVHFCNAAISSAVNAGRDVIAEEDVLTAEQIYSQFALDALKVENGITVREIEEVLYEFAGSDPVVPYEDALAAIERAQIAVERIPAVLRHLLLLSFFGVEVRPGIFKYPEGPQDLKKAVAMSEKLERDSGAFPRFEIHPAYRAYLEIQE